MVYEPLFLFVGSLLANDTEKLWQYGAMLTRPTIRSIANFLQVPSGSLFANLNILFPMELILIAALDLKYSLFLHLSTEGHERRPLQHRGENRQPTIHINRSSLTTYPVAQLRNELSHNLK